MSDEARVSSAPVVVSRAHDPGEARVSSAPVIVASAPDPATARVASQWIVVAVANNFVPPPPPVAVAPSAVPARGSAFYMDSTLEYDGRSAGNADGLFPGVVLILSGGPTWAAGELLTITASFGIFTADDVGNVYVLHATDGTKARVTITAYISSTVVQGTATIQIPTSLQGASVATWDRAVDQVAGVNHLEGECLAIMGDDHVVGSPYNPRLPLRQVVNGVVDLGAAYTHIFVGLPYVSDLETLDIDRAGSLPSLKAGKLDVTEVGLMVLQSRPVFVGGRKPSNDAVDLLEGLDELPLPTDAEYETLVTGFRDINIQSEWDSQGHVFIRSIDPTPFTALAIIPRGQFTQP